MTKGEKLAYSMAMEGSGSRRADQRRRSACLSTLRYFAEVVLQVEATACRPRRRGVVRQAADAAPITARDLTRRDSKDSLSTPAVSFRARTNRHVPASLSSDPGRTILGPSHFEATRDESSAGKSEASTVWQTLEAIREAHARASPAGRREVPRADSGHTPATVSVHGH